MKIPAFRFKKASSDTWYVYAFMGDYLGTIRKNYGGGWIAGRDYKNPLTSREKAAQALATQKNS